MLEIYSKILENAYNTSFLIPKGTMSFSNKENFIKYKNALLFLVENGLLEEMPQKRHRITNKGREVYENEGIFTYLLNQQTSKARDEHKQEVDYNLSISRLELTKKILDDYKWTKWLSRFAFLISVGLAVLKLIEYLNK
ncbi:hypothetical protein C1T31_05075 [Hanstruepera neustonica]|uniref:Uncharacterized protein n=1 Tax=Hanstruepera neustonica TaxID=1445657 RepID=A0A2K1E0B6_9FLAO|nr:hypothetical protein [Hanstruepera neustonica]PNQ73709.1 hypothetical protein C1T31_05075 [Hanstruepera neustonica]